MPKPRPVTLVVTAILCIVWISSANSRCHFPCLGSVFGWTLSSCQIQQGSGKDILVAFTSSSDMSIIKAVGLNPEFTSFNLSNASNSESTFSFSIIIVASITMLYPLFVYTHKKNSGSVYRVVKYHQFLAIFLKEMMLPVCLEDQQEGVSVAFICFWAEACHIVCSICSDHSFSFSCSNALSSFPSISFFFSLYMIFWISSLLGKKHLFNSLGNLLPRMCTGVHLYICLYLSWLCDVFANQHSNVCCDLVVIWCF